MIGLLVTASILWIGYGIASSDVPVIATNAGTLALNAIILGAKARFG